MLYPRIYVRMNMDLDIETTFMSFYIQSALGRKQVRVSQLLVKTVAPSNWFGLICKK